MQTKRLFIYLILFMNGTAYAQVVDADSINTAVNYAYSRLAFEYCKNYAFSHPDSREEAAFEKIKSQFHNTIDEPDHSEKLSTLLQDNHFESMGNIEPEFSKIKQRSPPFTTYKEAIQAIVKLMFENPKLHKIDSIAQFDSGARQAFATQLESFFKVRLLQKPGKPAPGKDSTWQERTSARMDLLAKEIGEIRMEEESLSSQFGNFIIITAVILLGAGWVLRRRFQRLRAKLQYLQERPLVGVTEFEKMEWSGYKVDIKELKERILQYENYLSSANSAIQSLQNEVSLLPAQPGRGQDEYKPATATPALSLTSPVLYASVPNKDSSFSVHAISELIHPSERFYKISLLSDHRASFEFMDDERAAQNASSAPDLILWPVCTIQNSPGPSTKKIRTVKPGIIVKQSDKWKLDTPATIIYE